MKTKKRGEDRSIIRTIKRELHFSVKEKTVKVNKQREPVCVSCQQVHDRTDPCPTEVEKRIGEILHQSCPFCEIYLEKIGHLELELKATRDRQYDDMNDGFVAVLVRLIKRRKEYKVVR